MRNRACGFRPRLRIEPRQAAGWALLVYLAAFCLRLADIFVFRLDELWGEIIVSKAAGFCLVLGFLALAGMKPTDIGFRQKGAGRALLLGFSLSALALAAGYAAECLFLSARGAAPLLVLGALDPKAGVEGGALFALWLFFGNIVNSFMEEGLFRGLMIALFLLAARPAKANLLQALLFGAWHLVWVPKWWMTGRISSPEEAAFALLSNFLPQFLMGLVWGRLALESGSLWAPWAAHTAMNSALNFLHVESGGSAEAFVALRMAVAILASLLAIPAFRRAARGRAVPMTP
ncbi:MAG: CPBP family intramembrane metalloprotease [Spirochaetaceae bacterium]|nr:CPBP family intramembrane metalloprotease [Spirochaetaceae bacterium]